VGYVTRKPDFYPDPREVDKVIEISLDEINNPKIISRKTLIVRGVEIETPFYDIKETTVWGATAMMISELLTILDSLEKY
jgi:hypothetical protein